MLGFSFHRDPIIVLRVRKFFSKLNNCHRQKVCHRCYLLLYSCIMRDTTHNETNNGFIFYLPVNSNRNVLMSNREGRISPVSFLFHVLKRFSNRMCFIEFFIFTVTNAVFSCLCSVYLITHRAFHERPGGEFLEAALLCGCF